MTNRHSGFTLIELSIVIMIIGMIMGGITIGQDLITASQVRAEIAQIGQYNLAVQTFSNKYNCLAGDCPSAAAFFSGAYNGDGDKIISSNYEDAFDEFHVMDSEATYIFDHLARAGLIALTPFDAAASADMRIGKAIPSLKMYPDKGMMIGCSYQGPPRPCNYFLLGATYPGTGSEFDMSPAVFSPTEAYLLDQKMDDGVPFIGNVVSSSMAQSDSSLHFTASIPAASGACVTTATGNPYNIADSNRRCVLRVKAAF